MALSRDELIAFMEEWNTAWENYDIDRVVQGFSDDAVFENWTGGVVRGKEAIAKAWGPWFANHGGFKFHFEDLFVDQASQKVLFRWALHWPSLEKGRQGQPEVRRGVDVITFKDGKISEKLTYCKTTLEIDGQRVALAAG